MSVEGGLEGLEGNMRIVSGLALMLAAGSLTYGVQIVAHHSTAEFNYARLRTH